MFHEPLPAFRCILFREGPRLQVDLVCHLVIATSRMQNDDCRSPKSGLLQLLLDALTSAPPSPLGSPRLRGGDSARDLTNLGASKDKITSAQIPVPTASPQEQAGREASRVFFYTSSFAHQRRKLRSSFVFCPLHALSHTRSFPSFPPASSFTTSPLAHFTRSYLALSIYRAYGRFFLPLLARLR